MLQSAYQAAHTSFPDVLIAHAAFLVPQVFTENMTRSTESYSTAYEQQQQYYDSLGHSTVSQY